MDGKKNIIQLDGIQTLQLANYLVITTMYMGAGEILLSMKNRNY